MTTPPAVLDPMVLQWRCRRCTRCCRSWRIDVLPEALRAMALRCTEAGQLDAALRLLAEHPGHRRLGGFCSLPMRPDGTCLFLDGQLCGYRLQHGLSTLPASCTKFPFVGLRTPRRRLLGLSFTCPTALELLVQQDRLEIDEDAPEPVAAPVLHDFCGEGESRAAAERFWQLHWEWLDFLRRTEGDVAARLRRLAEQASGRTLAGIDLEAALWSSPAWDRRAGAELLEAGADEAVLTAVFEQHPGCAADEPAVAATVGDELCDRYLLHRLMVPEFLFAGASLGRLLGVGFALVARYRIERARGLRPAAAVARLDRLVLHSDFVLRLFADGVDETAAWSTLALLALAR